MALLWWKRKRKGWRRGWSSRVFGNEEMEKKGTTSVMVRQEMSVELNCLRTRMSSQPEDDFSCFIMLFQGIYSLFPQFMLFDVSSFVSIIFLSIHHTPLPDACRAIIDSFSRHHPPSHSIVAWETKREIVCRTLQKQKNMQKYFLSSTTRFHVSVKLLSTPFLSEGTN